MKQSKKIGWVSVLFVLMFSLHPGIVAASDSTTLAFPGDGYVGVSSHTEIPPELAWMISALTQQSFNHTWVTAIVEGVQGVIHSDGVSGVHFLCWSDFLEICEPGSIQLFKPDKKAIGYAELEGRGINLSEISPIFRDLLARRLGNLMIKNWIEEMLAYSGVPYDYFFTPGDEAIYCSELLGYGWNNTGSSIDLFPSKMAQDFSGWPIYGDLVKDTFLKNYGIDYGDDMDYMEVYDLADILENSYFEEISID